MFCCIFFLQFLVIETPDPGFGSRLDPDLDPLVLAQLCTTNSRPSLFFICLFRLEEKYANGTLDMDLALKAFRRLKEEFHQEFTEFELQVLSATVADQQCC